MEQKLTLSEIAAIYKLTPKTFSRHVRKNNIPYERIGRSMRFDLPTVRAYLAASADPPPHLPRRRASIGRKGGNKYAVELGV